mmetsp:Transcript_24433/g.35481  ORF Transcript_24433/g.35481 Transcript_24433/m.35481 type:complete len:127 (+) Transcript_24433:604-984(+)
MTGVALLDKQAREDAENELRRASMVRHLDDVRGIALPAHGFEVARAGLRAQRRGLSKSSRALVGWTGETLPGYVGVGAGDEDGGSMQASAHGAGRAALRTSAVPRPASWLRCALIAVPCWRRARAM